MRLLVFVFRQLSMSHVRLSAPVLSAAERSGKLDLHNQNLSHFPDSIWTIPNVTAIDISGNGATEISPLISRYVF